MKIKKSSVFFGTILSLFLMLAGVWGISFVSQAERYSGSATAKNLDTEKVSVKLLINGETIKDSFEDGEEFSFEDYDIEEDDSVSLEYSAFDDYYLYEITNGEPYGWVILDDWEDNSDFESYMFLDYRTDTCVYDIPFEKLNDDFTFGCELISREKAGYEDFWAGDGQTVIEYSFQIGEDGDDGIGKGGSISFGDFEYDDAEVVATKSYENFTKVVLNGNKTTVVITPESGYEVKGLSVDGEDVDFSDSDYIVFSNGIAYFTFSEISNENEKLPELNVDFESYEGPLRENDFTFHVEGCGNDVKLYYKVGTVGDDRDFVEITDIETEAGFGRFNITSDLEECGEDFNDELTFRLVCETQGKDVLFADFMMDDSEVTENITQPDEKTWEYVLTPVCDNERRNFCMTFGYVNSGRTEINDVINDNIYEYNIPENGFPGSEYSDPENPEFIVMNLRYALATELYNKYIFVPAYGEFGLNPGDPDWSINELVNRITFESASPTTVKIGDSNENESLATYVATVNWGMDPETDSPVISNVPVYYTEKQNCLLINVDGTLYLRVFGPEDGNDMKDFDGDGIKDGVLVIAPSINSVKAGGLGTDIYVRNQSDGLYTMDMFTKPEYEKQYWKDLNVSVRVMKNSSTYVKIDTEGETKNYGRITSDSGQETDSIWETGNSKIAYTYIGETSIHVKPVSDELSGILIKEITDVKLADATQEAGVEIDKSNLNDVKVTFKSNFYDIVKLIITYSDGSDKELTIKRTGLVIDYTYLAHDDNSTRYGRDLYGGDGPLLSYNYEEGQQVAVMATYYHPTLDRTLGADEVKLNIIYADGTSEVLSRFAFYDAEANNLPGCVDTTFFLLGFMPANDENGMITFQYFERNGHRGGINATVINAGYDDDSVFSGTQVGNGKGVYWNGEIKW